MTYITTKTDLTAQEVYDHVVRHAAGMDKPSTGEFGCAYRGENGRSCFIGCLMPDDAAMEGDRMSNESDAGGSVAFLYDEGVLPKNLRPHFAILQDLQPVHDNDHMEDWPRALRLIGQYHKLDTAIVDEAFASRT